MRFILNFFLFGFLFFLIWIFFPEAFHILLSWAQSVYDFFADLVPNGADSVKDTPSPTPPPAQP
ncbi:MAG: hypothetical protein H0X51_03495 [Parachlamydiaceae bacterium]|nr:hypothetical protein [Parachlamydiaceae bacterium]